MIHKKLIWGEFFCLIFILFSCSKTEAENVWSPEWFDTATHINQKFVDLIYFAGTEIDYDYDSQGNEIHRINLTDSQKAKLEGEYREAYTLMCPDSVNFFAPYYHQCTMHGFDELPATIEEAWQIVRYYLDNINNGRPFIIAGFSQGAIMAQNVVAKLSAEELSRMIAAYSIGFGLSPAMLLSPNIKPATGEFDKGVVISFNSAPSKEEVWSMIMANTEVCINPVNWKTDATPATYTYDGMTLTNHIDPETHCIFVDGFDHLTHPSVLPGVSPLWSSKNLHVYEVRMYAPYLRLNIKDRAYR